MIITEHFTRKYVEYFAIFNFWKIIKNSKIITNKGPHYRLLIYYTYLDIKYYGNKTKYKYIIDCIDHFTKFYWAFLTIDKKEITTLKKIKSFIAINK